MVDAASGAGMLNVAIKDGVACQASEEGQGEQGIVEAGEGINDHAAPERRALVVVVDENKEAEPSKEGLQPLGLTPSSFSFPRRRLAGFVPVPAIEALAGFVA